MCNRLGGHIPNLPSLSSLVEQKHVCCHYHIYSTPSNNASQSQNAGKRETTYIYKNIWPYKYWYTTSRPTKIKFPKFYTMVYWFLKIQKHVTFSILKIQRIISYHKSQNIEWLICWTFTKIRKILHPSGNNTPVTICRNQESGIEKSFRRKTPCTHYSHTKGLKSGTRYPTRICNERITSTQTNI